MMFSQWLILNPFMTEKCSGFQSPFTFSAEIYDFTFYFFITSDQHSKVPLLPSSANQGTKKTAT
jgi:hypothetical protein